MRDDDVSPPSTARHYSNQPQIFTTSTALIIIIITIIIIIIYVMCVCVCVRARARARVCILHIYYINGAIRALLGSGACFDDHGKRPIGESGHVTRCT